MKKLKLFLMILPAMAAVACGEPETIQPEAPVVLGHLAKVQLFPGNSRFQVKGSSKDLSNVTAIVIGVDGKTFTAPLDHSTPNFSYIVEGVTSGDKTVSIKSIDDKEHESAPVIYAVEVFDKSLASAYTAVEITDAVFFEDDMTMTLMFSQSENIESLNLTYKNGKGTEVTEILPGNATTKVLNDWTDECEASITAVVRPYPNAIDSLALATSTVTLPKIVITPDEIIDLPNTTFADAEFASDIMGGQYSWVTGAAGLWDGEKYWSQGGYHSSDNDGVPHHVSFDLGVTARLAEVTIFFREDGGWTDWPPQKLQIWGHPDFSNGDTAASVDVADSPSRVDSEFCSESEGKGWFKLAEYSPTEVELRDSCKVTVPLDDTKIVRFFRYRIVEGWKEPHVGSGMYGGATEMELKAWRKSVKAIAK